MKKILIVGKTSYIGCAFEKWVQKQNPDWIVHRVSSRDEAWRQVDFGQYDSILHVAGIAHVNASADMEEDYYRVNRDLTVACCKKAKEEGAGQFIFLSSIIVYGESKSLEPMRITADTRPEPNGFYGQSKLEAEQGILPMQSPDFSVAVVRPPMVYGAGSKGNYRRLSKLAKLTPVFPNFSNKRSMIHIDNLCECLRLIVEEWGQGIYYPQNPQYVSTTELVVSIRRFHGKKMHVTKLFNGMLRLLAGKMAILNKIFGSLYYDKELSGCFQGRYQVVDLSESVARTESLQVERRKKIEAITIYRRNNALETKSGKIRIKIK